MEITALKLSKTNCFLIKNHNKYVLVDTGYEFEWALFSKRLREAGVDLSEISHLILTHHHDDHCGLLNKIVERNPDIRIIMSNLAEGPLKNGQNYHTPGSGHVNRRIHFILSLKQKVDKKWTHTFPPYLIRKNDILITKETTLKEIEIDLNGKIIATPGHSLDGISILFDDGDCIMGDAAANFLQFAGTKYCIISIDNLDEYYENWRKIIAGNAQQIFPAHGKPFNVEKLKKNLGKNKKKNMVLFN